MASPKPSCPKIHVTKNYRLFERSPENRVVDVAKHKRLARSLKKYGMHSIA